MEGYVHCVLIPANEYRFLLTHYNCHRRSKAHRMLQQDAAGIERAVQTATYPLIPPEVAPQPQIVEPPDVESQ